MSRKRRFQAREKIEHPPLGLDESWPFTKHKDQFTWAVIDDDPQYVEWCIETQNLQLTDEAWNRLQKRLAGDRR